LTNRGIEGYQRFRTKADFGMFLGMFCNSFLNCHPEIAALAVTSRYFAPFCPFLSLFASEQIMAIVATSACIHDLVFLKGQKYGVF